MPYRRIPAAFAATVLTAALAACSSSGSPGASATTSTSAAQSPSAPALSAGGFRQALQRIEQEENGAQHRVEQAFHARTVQQLRTGLAAFAADQRRAARRLTALTPPADAVAANAALARAFGDNATAVTTMLSKLAGASTVQQAMAIIQKDRSAQQVGHEIDAALGRLKRLGYTSGS